MKYFVIFLILIGSSGLIIPQAFGDNSFCNIDENLKMQEELIKDDDVLAQITFEGQNMDLMKKAIVASYFLENDYDDMFLVSSTVK